jgi:hypothetical protein
MTNRVAVTLTFILASLSAPWSWAQVPAGAEFRVNSSTTGDQSTPAVASDAAGNFVIAWTIVPEYGGYADVFAQRFDASGAARGAEFRVNSYLTGSQAEPAVTSDPAGNFVVVWGSYEQDGSGWGIFAQRFDASGAERGSEFQVNTTTAGYQSGPAVASDAAGRFVVAWTSEWQDGSWGSVFAQRFDASGARRGSEFQVNTDTIWNQDSPAIASDAAGNFVVAWTSLFQDGSVWGVFAQRFSASGARRGSEFQVNTYTTDSQEWPDVASDAAGNFIVSWASHNSPWTESEVIAQQFDASGARLGSEFRVGTDTTALQSSPAVAFDSAGSFVVTWLDELGDGSGLDVSAQRFDASGTPRGAEFQVNTYTTDDQLQPALASDAAGNFVIAWTSRGQDGSGYGVFAQRYGGLLPSALAVDASASAGSDGNGVLEVGESVGVKPSWHNVNGASLDFDGGVLAFGGPTTTGVSYTLQQAVGHYGTVTDGATAQCSDCYQVEVSVTGTRPATHWDATLEERLTPDALGQTMPWQLHVGESFTDVTRASSYYRFVETMLHNGVTSGCSASSYCPTSTSSRQQIAIFALVAKEGSLYAPPACGPTPMFTDVPVTSPYCKWVEELVRRGVAGGCGGGNFCPTAVVTRGQMPIFVLKTLDPTLTPPACTTPKFADLPASSPYCAWAEELARRAVVSGCGGGNYCPNSPVTRGQMAVFIGGTFGLSLYGP